jgi:CRP-like cAMP-binding protein
MKLTVLRPAVNGESALTRVPELARLPKRRLRRLLSQFDEVTVEPGTPLAVVGRPVAQYAVVLRGALEERGPAGVRRILPGESTGWRSMWDRGPSPVSVAAADRTRLLVMGRAQFRALRALGAEEMKS